MRVRFPISAEDGAEYEGGAENAIACGIGSSAGLGFGIPCGPPNRPAAVTDGLRVIVWVRSSPSSSADRIISAPPSEYR